MKLKIVPNLAVGKIKGEEADHVIENRKKQPTDRKKKDAKNRNRRAVKKKIENLPSRKYLQTGFIFGSTKDFEV